MDEIQALDAFAALSQETRLRIVTRLAGAAPGGMAAGALADAVGVSPSNLSFHLAHLERCGLVGSRREARSIIYTAELGVIADLSAFLMRDCCGGRPELCAPSSDMHEHPAKSKETTT